MLIDINKKILDATYDLKEHHDAQLEFITKSASATTTDIGSINERKKLPLSHFFTPSPKVLEVEVKAGDTEPIPSKASVDPPKSDSSSKERSVKTPGSGFKPPVPSFESSSDAKT
jgi:hypothetical protein